MVGPFLALLIALFQTVLVFFAERVLDETTEQASRYIFTGQAQQSKAVTVRELCLPEHLRALQLWKFHDQCREL
jgi:hypothetical protein